VQGDIRPDLPPADASSSTLWFRGEYLLWKVNRASVPALVGTIPNDTAELVREFPNSTITPLFGGSASSIDFSARSGLRLEAGCWLDADRQYGVQVGFFQLEQGQQHFSADSQGTQALGPVFFRDASFGQEVLVMDGVPGLRTGTVTVGTSQRLWGTEVNFSRALSAGNILDHVELLAGFRQMQFSEGILIRGTSQTIPGGHLPCG
jgi:hypothetical protein